VTFVVTLTADERLLLQSYIRH